MSDVRTHIQFILQSDENPEPVDPETGEELPPYLYAYSASTTKYGAAPGLKSTFNENLAEFLTPEEGAQLQAILDRYRATQKAPAG